MLPCSLTFTPKKLASILYAVFNPAVTLSDAIEHDLPWPEAAAYMLVQFAGGIAGVRCWSLRAFHWMLSEACFRCFSGGCRSVFRQGSASSLCSV